MQGNQIEYGGNISDIRITLIHGFLFRVFLLSSATFMFSFCKISLSSSSSSSSSGDLEETSELEPAEESMDKSQEEPEDEAEED